MATVDVSLVIPASGAGAASDVSTFGAQKTIVSSGTFQGIALVEAAGAAGVWCTVAYVRGAAIQTITVAATQMRVRIPAGSLGGPGSIQVAAQRASARSVALAIPAADGVGASSALAQFGAHISMFVAGAFSGSISVELSQDDAAFGQPFQSLTAANCETVPSSALFARVIRTGVVAALPGAPTVEVVSVTDDGPLQLYNVRDFGFVPSNTGAQNVAAWATIAAFITAQGGAAFFIPPGSYNVDGSLSVPANTTLLGSKGAVIVMDALASLDGSPIMVFAGNDVSIRQVGFDGQRALQPADGFSDSYNGGANGQGRAYRSLINGEGFSRIWIEGCDFTGGYGAAIALRDCSFVWVRANYVHDNNFELLFDDGSAGVIEDIICDNNVIENLNSGDATVNADCFVIANARRVVVTNTQADTVARAGIKIDGADGFVCAGNNINNYGTRVGVVATPFAGISVQDGPLVTTRDGVVEGNILTLGNVGVGLNIADDTGENIVIANNTIRDMDGASGPTDGILLGAGRYTRIQIVNNVMTELGRSGITIADSANDSRIAGNVMRSVADGLGYAIFGEALSGDCDNLTIENNEAFGFKGLASTGAVFLTRTGAFVFNDLQFRRNQIYPPLATDLAFVVDTGDADFVATGAVDDNVIGGQTAGDLSGVAVEYRRNDVAGTDAIQMPLPRFIGFVAAAPVSGYYVQGSYGISSGATAGGSAGFICVTTGSPGTWKTWGAIAP